MANEVKLGIVLDTKKALKSIASFSGAAKSGFDSIALAATGINAGLELVGKGFAFVGSAISSTIAPALDFSASLQEIQTLLNEGEVSTGDLGKTILSLQKQFGGKQKGIATAYYNAISSGAVTAADAQGFLEDANKLAIGGVTDISTAVDGLTTIISSFGLEADRTAEISDSLFIAMKRGKTTVGELSAGVAIASSSAGALGVDFKELLASASALTTGGLSTSVAFTQIRATMTGLTKPTKDLQKIMDDLNITSIKSEIANNGLVGTLQRLVKQTDGSAESLGKLFGSTEAVGAVTALTSKTIGTTFVNALEEMESASLDAGETSAEAFGKISSSASFQFDKLKGIIAASFTEIGTVITDKLGPILKIAQNIAGGLGTALAKGLKEASKSLGKAEIFNPTKIQGNFVKFINLVLNGFNLAAKAATVLATTVLDIGIAFTEIGGVGFIVSGFTKASILWDSAVTKIARSYLDIAGTIAFLKGDIQASLDFAAASLEADKALDELAGNLAAVPDGDFAELATDLTLLRDGIQEVGDAVTIAIDTTVATLSEGVKAAASDAKKAAQEIRDAEGDRRLSQRSSVQSNSEITVTQKNDEGFFNGFGEGVKDVFESGGSTFGKSAISAFSKGGEEGAKQLIGAAGTALATAIGGPVVGGAVGELLNLLMTDGAAELVTGLVESIPTIIETLAENMPLVAAALITTLANPLFSIRVANAFIDGFTKGLDQVFQEFKAGFSLATGQGFIDFKNQLGGIGVSVREALDAGITEFVVDFKKGFAPVRDAILEPFNIIASAFDDIAAAIDKLIQNITGGEGSVGGKIKSGFSAIGKGELPKFADGGVIPSGFNNDTFPALLTSGEGVITRDTTDELTRFLGRQSSVESMLAKLVDMAGQPIVVQSSVELDGNAFADINLELERRGVRTA